MDEISPTNEMKKMQKGSSLPASSALPVENERERSIDTESKTKERRLSLLNLFKFQRRKSVKELSQEINSDCERNSVVALSRPMIKSNNAVAIRGAFANDKGEDLSQNKGIDCKSIEVGDLPKMDLDEGQQKTGRWQHVKARLQHRIVLPSRPEVNLSLDTSAKKKSTHRKPPVDSASLKMHLSNKSNYAGDEQTGNFFGGSRQSAKLTDNSTKVPWLRKTSLPCPSFSVQSLCPSENMASDLDKAQHIRTNCTSSVHGSKPNQMPVNCLKGHEQTYVECAGVNVSSPLPAFSSYSRSSKNSDCITLNQKLNGNKNCIEEANVTRHLSQLHISFQDDPSRISYSDENETVNKSPADKQIPISHISSVAQTRKRTTSLPNIANSDGKIFEYTNDKNAEVTNVGRIETERNDSELVLNQNHAAFQNLQKKKRFSLAAYRDRNELMHNTGLNREDPSVVFKQRMSGEGVGLLGRPIKTVSRDRHSISSAVMFTRKSHVDIKKSAQKILDSRKELLTRLKHLRVILESFDIAETKAYFEQYFSILYFLFHESFTNVETNLGQRVSKGHKEELDFALLVLEKILTLLPDLIHKRWQLHSIGQIMKKLLHPGNSPKLRREGIRLFVMWYGILMDNATDDCHGVFRSFIPQMLSSGDNFEMESSCGKPFLQTKVTIPDVAPLLPSQAGEVQPDEPCSWSLDCLLAYIASETNRIHWSNSEMQEHCLKFLFDKFKDHYIPVIFPNLAWKASIYEPSQDLPEKILLSNGYDRTLALCQESVIKWIARYTLTPSLQNPEIPLQIPENNAGTAEAELVNPGSNASTLSVGSSWMENALSGLDTDRNKESFVEQEIIQNVFYSSRENVNIIHEVLRQAFLCPFQIHRSQMVRQVITIYWSWFQNQERPIFMQEPKLKRASCSKYPNKRQSVTSTSSGQTSYQLSTEDAEADVRAGLQRVLRVFITNSSALFMFDSSFTDKDSVEQQLKLEDQVDICKKVLKMYRDIVTNITLDKATWEQLLMVLLKVLSTMLTVSPTVNKENSLSGRLAESLFKTMMLAWLKANLSTVVSQQLWKSFTETLSSFTSCVHLIRQWSKTMELLTRILSQCIYDIDLRDLPLDKLNKRKVNRLPGAKDGLKRCEKDSSLTRNLLEQIMGGVTSRQQKLSSSAVETAASKSDGSVGSSIRLSGSQLNSVSDQNEVLHSKCQSQFNLSVSKLSSNTDACSRHRHQLLRRNSDSNIVIESEKREVPHLRVSDVEDCEAQQISDVKVDDVFHNDTEETSSQGHRVQSELAGVYNSCLVAHQRTSVTDCTSVSSTDSSLLPYSALVNSSCVSSSSGANIVEPNSCSDSDTEALLRASDSGSGSSRGVCQRPKLKSLGESSSYSKEIILTEEDEEKEGIEEENLVTETTNGTMDDDDEDGAATVCDFEKKKKKQDRDSLQIEDDEAFNVLCSSISPASERQSFLQSGEHVVSGWTPDIALVLWQRMLGCLGNVNEIKDSGIHRQVFEFLSDLLDIFIKIRDNQGVSKDNQTTPPEPTFVPPIFMFSSWCFEAFKLPEDYKQGKLVAYQILCTSIMQRQDVDLPHDHLHRFFLVLHYGLTCGSQDVANVLIRCCNAKFFSRLLPGSTLMMLDFIRGARTVLSQPVEAKNVPRAEAMSLLGSLLCFQNLLQEIPVLDPNSEDFNVIKCSDIKETILDILLKFARNEPTGSSQCIAIDALGLYLHEELCHPKETLHPKLTAAFDILLSMLKLTDRAAVLTTTHVLLLLSDHVPLLLLKLPDLPCEVVKDMTSAVAHFLTTAQSSSSEESKRTTSQILISVMFAMLEWCMRIPQCLLLSYRCQSDQFLLRLVFDALDMVVNGGNRTILSSAKTSRPTVTNDNQLSNETLSFNSAIDVNQEINFPAQKTERPDDDHCAASTHRKPVDEDHDSCGLKSAAKAIIFHLINYLNQFPMSMFGATQMSSNVEEHHDTLLEAIEQSDLSAQLLASNNTQFFVINNCALISFVEVPIQMVDQNRETSGLATEKTVCRIISRDPSGKHCWDSSILYGSQQSHSGPCLTDTQMLQRIEEEEDAKLEESDINSSQDSRLSLSDEDLQSCANMAPEDDILSIMLQYLSESSPECLLYTGEALNASFHIPVQLNQKVEGLMKDSLTKQQIEEKNYINQQTVDHKYVMSGRKDSSEQCRSLSPFHLCRLFLSQFGFITYEKRKNFDLLHKSEKLLRELKHLDNQRCRDTHKIAVIYVGPGQEDKVSILTNSAGSQSFNEFVSALGWQVNLQTHSGFMGGLQRNQTTGSTAPYYSTSTKEVIFHVSTLMPSETEEDQLRKLRHLGNDEVHIIWSEHKRDYRHGIIPTEFGDVLIVIYPLENGLFRIEIIQRPEVPGFGPLFNGAVVSFRVLPGLVRATAIGAGQVLRTTRPHYQAFYEERMSCIDSIVKKYKLLTTFEAFSSQICAPSPHMDAENAPYANPSLDQSQLQPLTKISKGGHKSRWRRASTDALFHRGEEDQQATYRKLSLAGGKQKKQKKMQSVSTPPLPLSPSFDIQQIK